MPGLVFHPNYDIPLPDGHRFPATKFSRLMARLGDTGIKDEFTLLQPDPVNPADLRIVHDPKYIDAIATGGLTAEELRVLGLSWSEILSKRSFLAVNGTLLAARHAIKNGLACHAAGGTHHAHHDYGAGFCVFNDLAYAATKLADEGAVGSVLIIDCDVHQGDGTARILEHDDRIFTCSLHCRTNYPARKATSNLDVEIEKGADDAQYLEVLDTALGMLDERGVKPDLVIYDAGVDIHSTDRLGYLEVTDQGVLARDIRVISHFRDQHIPVATVIGGGYGEDQDEVARRHALVFGSGYTPPDRGLKEHPHRFQDLTSSGYTPPDRGLKDPSRKRQTSRSSGYTPPDRGLKES